MRCSTIDPLFCLPRVIKNIPCHLMAAFKLIDVVSTDATSEGMGVKIPLHTICRLNFYQARCQNACLHMVSNAPSDPPHIIVQPSMLSIIGQFTFVCLDAFCAKASGQPPTPDPTLPFVFAFPSHLARLTFMNSEDRLHFLSSLLILFYLRPTHIY